MDHRIHHQRWQIHAPSGETAFEIRRQLRTQLETALLPVFEHAFDALGAGDDVVHIPRLMLDVKVRPEGDFITALTDVLPTVLQAKLEEIFRNADFAHHPRSVMQRLTSAASLRNSLLNYLSTGILKWYDHDTKTTDTLLTFLRSEAVALSHERSALFDAIRGSLRQRIAASFRLLQLLPDESRTTLLTLTPRDSSFPDNTAMLTNMLPGLLSQFAISGNITPEFAGALDSYLLRVQAIMLAVKKEDLHPPLAAHFLTLLHECHRQATAENTLPDMLSATETFLKTCQLATSADEISQGIENAGPVTLPSARHSTAYLSSDAGLLLLHPFLPHLFDVLDLTPTVNQLPRAAALLHWLVSGREQIHEFELTCIKVLLGLAPDQMLLVGAGLLSETDRIEGDAMLASAISHWDALGKTSITAFRNSFLQRRGLLREIDSGWQLQVEPEAFDLLMAKLPWRISIVKLPWMNRPVFTEWLTP